MKSTIWKTLILIKGHAILLQICYDEISDFLAEVQDTLSYQHELCMKKGHAFKASIKCSNGLETLDEDQSKESNHCETTNTWRWRLYVEEALRCQWWSPCSHFRGLDIEASPQFLHFKADTSCEVCFTWGIT